MGRRLSESDPISKLEECGVDPALTTHTLTATDIAKLMERLYGRDAVRNMSTSEFRGLMRKVEHQVSRALRNNLQNLLSS